MHNHTFAALLAFLYLTLAGAAHAEDEAPLLHADFSARNVIESGDWNFHRVQPVAGKPLEFSGELQYAELSAAAMRTLAKEIDGAAAMTVGCWVFPRTSGEQTIFSRELPQVAPLGERMFRPRDDFVNFCLGTEQRGFFYGTIHGNGKMPFPLVTLAEVKINAWHQLIVVKTDDGYQRFYHNGALVFDDHHSAWSGVVRKFTESRVDGGEPLRVMLPRGGLVGEVFVHARELSAAEIARDFESKRERYHPAHPGTRIELREMNELHAHGLWKDAPTRDNWPRQRERILAGVENILGPMPEKIVPLEAKTHGDEDCGTYVRRKISFAVQPDDRLTAYLLVPKKLVQPRVPAIICFYGTTSGAGKDTTVRLSGGQPGTRPEKNRSFAIDMVEAGFVTLAADYLRDGERIAPGDKPYDSTRFYKQFPKWSVVGKDAWDNRRICDYLQSLEFVDPERIGMVGHSYGGHSTIFAAALEPRIKVAVSNGPVSEFLDHGEHWGRPSGAGGGEYIRGLRPYVLDHMRPLPVAFHEFTALIAPRPLLVGQAVGERRPKEEENYAAVVDVYEALGRRERVRYHWYAGDHDFPPEARAAAVAWFERWFAPGALAE